jgi:3',5'-cyclic AMP phosphodiesterase CpdA
VYGSSNVEAIKYDEGAHDCYVRFHGGAVYVYHDVSREEWEELFHATSKGKMVAVFRRAKEYEKVAGEALEQKGSEP